MSKHTVQPQIQSHFAEAVHADVPRSVIPRNSTIKTTFNAGDLVPIYCDEVLPADTFEMDMSFISRLMTPIFPTMDILNLDFYAFFVPNRIVWDGWEQLMGENKSGPWVPATPPALVPTMAGTTVISQGCIGDYYGLPLGISASSFPISSLPFRGYGLIWNEWFRDQNLQAPLVINKGNTESSTAYRISNPLLKVNKKHDYFTSCLPAPQKGESALIPIELGDLIPVIAGADTPHMSGTEAMRLRQPFGGGYLSESQTIGVVGGTGTLGNAGLNAGVGGNILQPANLWADGRGLQLNATTISELRTAFQIQKLFERDARGGTRYVEMLKAHFGVDAQDYRLQRPEFLGHAHSYVGMQQITQTSSTDSTSPQGNLAAFSYTAGQNVLFKKSFTEHGIIHIFAVARHPKTYQQGIDKMFSRRDRLDFYMPVLAHISEQPVLVKEIYSWANANELDDVFGYNEAWAEYRYKPNRVTGQMRAKNLYNPNSLENWNYAEYYSARPYLSNDWIQDNSKINVARTLAVSTQLNDQIMMDIAFRCKATRPMPVHSIPGLVDHF